MSPTGKPFAAGVAVATLSLLAFSGPTPPLKTLPENDGPTSGQALYEKACAGCHGSDGRGLSQIQLGFTQPVPDFTDCNFASREPAADWVAIAHEGGPVRGFSRMMPAFGDALTVQELEQIIDYIGSLCPDRAWPRGELNLPRALFTEKAYPEDEAVLTTTVATEGSGNIGNKFVYEKRFGSRNQLEIVIPFSVVEQTGADLASEWNAGLGDVAFGVKRALYHNAESGTIASITGEVVLPTGDESDGFGKGTTVFEPFASFGQILPFDTFVQAQAGLELPANTDRAENEGFWRVLIGKSMAQRGWGRTWSPMVEVLASRELEGPATTAWDLVPQVQVTLNRRQHIMANIGVRIPLTEPDVRNTQVAVYILWDWFDGGFMEGW